MTLVGGQLQSAPHFVHGARVRKHTEGLLRQLSKPCINQHTVLQDYETFGLSGLPINLPDAKPVKGMKTQTPDL